MTKSNEKEELIYILKVDDEIKKLVIQMTLKKIYPHIELKRNKIINYLKLMMNLLKKQLFIVIKQV